MRRSRSSAMGMSIGLWLVVAGCGGPSSSTPAPESAEFAPAQTGSRQVTLHIPGMVEQLKLL